jgi:hypothetical protein
MDFSVYSTNCFTDFVDIRYEKTRSKAVDHFWLTAKLIHSKTLFTQIRKYTVSFTRSNFSQFFIRCESFSLKVVEQSRFSAILIYNQPDLLKVINGLIHTPQNSSKILVEVRLERLPSNSVMEFRFSTRRLDNKDWLGS